MSNRFVAEEFTLVEPFKFVVKEKVIESVPKGYLLLKPIVAAICGSEILYFKGKKEKWKMEKRLPMCLLHEGVAEVIEAGEDTKLGVGTNVVVNPMISCGECIGCEKGDENFCQNPMYMAATADGLARTYFLYPSYGVIPVPLGVELEIAALTEPLSIALNAFEVSEVKPGDRVSVIGDGPMGYMITLIVSYVGGVPKDNLYMVGIVDEKISLASDFASTVNLIKEKTVDLESKFDVAFEVVGGRSHRATIAKAIEVLRPGGRCTLLGLSQGEVPIEISKIVNRGLICKGSIRSRMEHYIQALKLLQNEEFRGKVKRIISKKRFTIEFAEDLEDAFRYADTEEGEARTKPGRVLVYFP
jgi:threonine dehydrogenase-like Zn-dependent dehydrogenase